MKGTEMSSLKRSLLTFLALILACGAAFAQGINGLQIVVKDVSGKEDIGSVEPGGTVDIEPGGSVRLIMVATGNGGRTIYPVPRFSDPTRGGIRITRANPENANADLDLSGATGGREAISYSIEDNRIPGNRRRGTFYVRVLDRRRSGGSYGNGYGSGYGNNGGRNGGRYGDRYGDRYNGDGNWYGNSRGDEITRSLYQAILLRDPDPGARGTIEAINRGGYDAVVRAAEGIARSEESRIRIYENGDVTNERRLISLYRNLLGLDSSDVDRADWSDDLRRLRDGRIGEVVSDMVRSERFRSRFGSDRRY